MSLRNLINIRIAVSVLLILLLASFITFWQARQSVVREVSASFNLAVKIIQAESAQQDILHTDDSWLEPLIALRHSRHLQISVINDDGVVSELLLPTEESAVPKPPSWFVSAVMIDPLEAEYRIHKADGSSNRIRVQTNPIDEISEAWSETKAYFLSLIVMVIAIFIAINAVFHSMLLTVKTILSRLKQVETGDYDERLPQFKIAEFDAIASEINELTDALNTARIKNQELARHTLNIQEYERQHMSRELHDEMGQSLTAIKALAVASKQPKTVITETADSIIDICNHVSGVVRSMMRTLHPLSLTDLGLYATLTDLVSEWQRRHENLNIQLDYDQRLEMLCHSVAIHVYRIVQESLTNVVRHAQADEVHILVSYTDVEANALVKIKVSDNGIGSESEGDGFGIRAMRERVENLGGEFQFTSSPGNGTHVDASMPFKMKSQDNDAA